MSDARPDLGSFADCIPPRREAKDNCGVCGSPLMSLCLKCLSDGAGVAAGAARPPTCRCGVSLDISHYCAALDHCWVSRGRTSAVAASRPRPQEDADIADLARFPVGYETICDHYREMARRFAERCDELKHSNRALEAELATLRNAASPPPQQLDKLFILLAELRRCIDDDRIMAALRKVTAIEEMLRRPPQPPQEPG